MVDLVLRPSGLPAEKKLPWALQLRWHESCGPTEYQTLCHVSDAIAREIIRSGKPYWLFGDPDDTPPARPAELWSEQRDIDLDIRKAESS